PLGEQPRATLSAPSPQRALFPSSLSTLCLDFRCLHLNRNLDVISDGDATRLQQLIPDQPEISSVDHTGSAESDALATPGILCLTLELHIKSNRPCHITDREGPRELALVPVTLDAHAAELALRVLVNVAAIGSPKVLMA